jgi:hypothetical protein
MYTIYKRKNQKIKFNDICVSDDFKSNDDVSWKKNIIKKKKYFKNLIDQFVEFFISKFFELTKEARLKFEWIQRMQIKDEFLKCEKVFLFEMLFNREIAFFWDFKLERFNSFENYVVHENSHDVSRSLTNSRISNSQSVNEDRRENDEKSNQKRRAWTLLWILSKFLISRKKKKKKSLDQCCFKDESSHHSKCKFVFCD